MKRSAGLWGFLLIVGVAFSCSGGSSGDIGSAVEVAPHVDAAPSQDGEPIDDTRTGGDAALPPGTVGAGGGTVEGPDGVTLVIPQGALTEATAISIERWGGEVDLGGQIAISEVYEILPVGLSFSEPASLRLPYDLGSLVEGVPSILVAETGAGPWEPVTGMPQEEGWVHGALVHLSIYVVTQGPCGAASCSEGCCQGLHDCHWGFRVDTCGKNGEACVACAPGSCSLEHVCKPCGKDNCDGCCSEGLCLPGTDEEHCGRFGFECVSCFDGWECSYGDCEYVCGPLTCSGCCDSQNWCQEGTSSMFCGTGGESCDSCPYDCFEGDCGVYCDMVSCADGCCADIKTCISPPTDQQCGLGGATCAPCAPDKSCEAGSCLGSGSCTCAGASFAWQGPKGSCTEEPSVAGVSNLCEQLFGVDGVLQDGQLWELYECEFKVSCL